MAVESCPVTQTSQIWKHHYQWNSCTLTWSAENKDRCTHFINGPAALTLKLIFILYSTPSFRTKACFLKASRSPVSNNKHRQINIRSKPSLQHFLISSVIRTSAIDSFIHAILSLSRWLVFANFANLLSRDPSCVVSWLFGQAAVTIIMVLDFIKLLPQERPTGHADGGTWTSWTVAVDSSPPSCCGDPSWAWQPLKHKPAAGGAMLSSQRQQRRTTPPSSAAVQDETYWRGSWIYDFSQINYWVKHLHRKAGKKRELDSLQGTELLGHQISLHSDFCLSLSLLPKMNLKINLKHKCMKV